MSYGRASEGRAEDARGYVRPDGRHRVALHYGGAGTLVTVGTIFTVAGGTATTYKNEATRVEIATSIAAAMIVRPSKRRGSVIAARETQFRFKLDALHL